LHFQFTETLHCQFPIDVGNISKKGAFRSQIKLGATFCCDCNINPHAQKQKEKEKRKKHYKAFVAIKFRVKYFSGTCDLDLDSIWVNFGFCFKFSLVNFFLIFQAYNMA
jgi:hypothetical protein